MILTCVLQLLARLCLDWLLLAALLHLVTLLSRARRDCETRLLVKPVSPPDDEVIIH